MGQTLIEALLGQSELALAGAVDIPASPLIGRDAGERFGRKTGIAISADVAAVLRGVDVLIDFTRPAGTLAHLAACAGAGVAAVVGTTGLSDDDVAALNGFGARIPVVYAPNMSVGVNVLLKLVAMAAKSLGEAYDIEVLEMHHRHKVDAPSGTALQLGRAAAAALGRDLKRDGVFARDGVTGERPPRSIGFATLRGGDVVGEHSVIFAGSGTHRAHPQGLVAHELRAGRSARGTLCRATAARRQDRRL